MNGTNQTFPRGRKFLLISVIVIALAGIGMGSVQAQPNLNGGLKPVYKATPNPIVDGGELTADEPQTGDISSTQYFYTYTYTATEGEDITLTMEATDGLQPYVGIIPPKSNKALKVAQAKQDETAELEVTIPADGDYTVFATRVGVDKGKSTGSFTLTLSSGSGGSGGSGSDTTPAPSDLVDIDVSAYPEQIDVSSSTPLDVIKQLRAAKVIPSGGSAAINVPRSVIEVTQPKFSIVPIASGTKLKNFVLFFRLRFDEYGSVEDNKCGMAFRVGNTGYSIVGLSSTKHFVLEQVDGKDDVFNVDVEITSENFSVDTDVINTFTVVALDDVVLVYVNGGLLAAKQGKAATGNFATFVFNQEGNDEATGCAYSNIWVWG